MLVVILMFYYCLVCGVLVAWVVGFRWLFCFGVCFGVGVASLIGGWLLEFDY